MGIYHIGKIPGYNSRIDKGDSTLSYQDKLKSNLTLINFEPIGYSIQMGSITDSTKASHVYKIGKELNITTDIPMTNTSVSTKGALYQWKRMQELSPLKDLNGALITESFNLIGTNDSTINETLGNSYEPSILSKGLDSLSSSKLGQSTSLLAGGAKTLDSGLMVSMLESAGNAAGNANLLNLLGTTVGFQHSFPEVWKRSEYNNTSSFMIKLVAPSGHPDDVVELIIKPLLVIILAGSPITSDGMTSGFPPLWRIRAKGLVDINIGAIKAITINRGGQDTVFNKYNQPTNIDVRITVEPIVSGFATAYKNGLNMDLGEETSSGKESSSIMQGPVNIANPMTQKATSYANEVNALVL